MKNESRISGLLELGKFLKNFLGKTEENFSQEEMSFNELIFRTEIENPWFTSENLKFCFNYWSEVLQKDFLEDWLERYSFSKTKKRIGLILAGNIPLVGFHDVLCVILSGHTPVIKLSSKDRLLLPFLLELWKNFSAGDISKPLHQFSIKS